MTTSTSFHRRAIRGLASPICLALLLSVSPVSTRAEIEAAAEASAHDLLELSLEELLNIEVTTVLRRSDPLSRAPAAVHVITQDDLRRSGATTLPEALRLAPGIQVARVHAHQWAVSARGFNDVFANKLLVMMDGRTVYTPLFSGVFWDAQHTLLEDVDRIEVIRGPGASLWGANAVNGVINIITKDARETQGTLVSLAAGNHDRFLGAIRQGGKIGDGTFFRVYFQHHDHDAFPGSGEMSGRDDSWRHTQGGFRADKDLSDISVLTIQGDVYSGRLNEVYVRLAPTSPYNRFIEDGVVDTGGGNIHARITRSLEDEADLTLRSYFEATRRDSSIFREERQTFDVDLQHRLPVVDRHLVTWGGGYRLSVDDVENSFDVSLHPNSRTLQLFSFFVQDEVEVVEDKLSVTLGSKIEHNDFTGFEVQPGGRLSWTPRERQTVWGAISRAVRTPSRGEHDIRLNQEPVFPPNAFGPGSPAMITSLLGSSDFESEELTAYEIGYRIQPNQRVSFDLATFYNDYENLRSIEPGVPQPGADPAHVPFLAGNELEGETYGFELGTNWTVIPAHWRLYGSYSLLRMHLRQSGTSGDPQSVEGIEGSSPRHQWLVRSSVDFPRNWQWDTWFRFVDHLPAQNVDSYLEMDMRLAWRPFLPRGDRGDLEVALVGRNLIERSHREFAPSLIQNQQAEIRRSFYVKLTWSY